MYFRRISHRLCLCLAIIFTILFSSSGHSMTQEKVGLVLDFDNTITRKHSNLRSTTQELMTQKDQDSFREVIQLLQDKGVHISIASYGYKSVILSTMQDILGEDNIFTEDNVITPPDVSDTWKEGHAPPKRINKNKNDMLQLIKDRFGLDQILLIDDSSNNVFSAVDAGYLAEKVYDKGNMETNALLIIEHYFPKYDFLP